MTTSRIVALTHARLQELLHYDPETGVFTWKVNRGGGARAGNIAGSLKKDTGYVVIRIDGVEYKAHRLAWFYVYKSWPTHEIDHDNRNKSLNSISNLKDRTRQQNQLNIGVRCNNTSGTTGVSWSKSRNKWYAYIRIDQQLMSLGYYHNKQEAVDARRKAEQRHRYLEACRSSNSISIC